MSITFLKSKLLKLLRSIRRAGSNMLVVAARELRLVIGLIMILFLTSELWRVVGKFDLIRLLGIVCVTLGLTFLLVMITLPQLLPATVSLTKLYYAILRVIGEAIAFGAIIFLGLIMFGLVILDQEIVSEWCGKK